MTAPEMIDLLAQQTWKSAMAYVFKDASEQFKARQKAIDNYHKAIAAERKLADQEQKAAEQQAKKAEANAEKARLQAERTAACGHGRGSQTICACGSGQGWGHGQGCCQDCGQGGLGQTMLAYRSESNDLELQTLDSDSGSTDQEDIQNHNTSAC